MPDSLKLKALVKNRLSHGDHSALEFWEPEIPLLNSCLAFILMVMTSSP